MKDKPLSENIQFYEAGKYVVSAGIWRPIAILGGESYEIGIREKKTGKFYLLQGDFNFQTVQECSNAIAMLLADESQCYTPEWCLEHFK